MTNDCSYLKILLNTLSLVSQKPRIFEPGESLFWDDPHIAQSMLAAHLNPAFDGASRKSKTIEKTIEHLISTATVRRGDTVLDLGCGPGLYSSRLSLHGINVTGIDISNNSINYAQQAATKQGLDITYICGSFFDIDYEEKFDSILQIYGELCTFCDEKRDQLLNIIHKSLKDGGLFIFDVSTRKLRLREGLKSNWYFSDGGFWYPKRHIVLEQGFDYPQKDMWLNQYTIINEVGEIKTYRLWFHDYSLETLSPVLHSHGFKIEQVWNDLTGSSYTSSGDWIAIAARKI